MVVPSHDFIVKRAMKEVKPKVKPPASENWLLPDNQLSQNDLISGIKNAENVPFWTVQESMEHFEQWLREKEKKDIFQ